MFGRARPGSRLWLLLLLIVGFGLRIYRIADSNVWWDEGYSVFLARKGLIDLAVETASDVHPPVHYWLLHFWIKLVGESEFAMRFSSLLFGVLGIALIYWLGKRFFSERVGLLTATLLTISRFQIEWSQQIRMYTLVFCLVIFSYYLTVRLWERESPRLWLAYIALTSLGLHILYISGLVPLIESLATLLLVVLPGAWLGGRRLSFGFLGRWIGAEVIALGSFLPWLYLFKTAPHPTPVLIYPISLWDFLRASATAFPLGISAYVERYTPITVLSLLILLLGVWIVFSRGSAVADTKSRRPLGFLLALLVFLPPFIVYGLSFPNPLLYAPNLSVRYLLVFLPAYLLLVSVALAEPRRWPLLNALGAIFLVGASLLSLYEYYPTRRLSDDYKTVSRYLLAHSKPDDAVLLDSDRDWPIYEYHTPGGPTRYGAPSLRPITEGEAKSLVDSILAKHPSLWLLISDNAYDSDPNGYLPRYLASRARLVGKIDGEHREIRLYSQDTGRSISTPTRLRIERTLDVQVSDSARLVGIDPALSEPLAGDTLRFAFYWRGGPAVKPGQSVIVSLEDRSGVALRAIRASLPTNSDEGEAPVRSDYSLALPKDMSPGEYWLALSGYSNGTEKAILQTITVRLTEGPTPADTRTPVPTPEQPITQKLGDAIELSGFDLSVEGKPSDLADFSAIRPGDKISLRLHWKALAAIPDNYTVFVQLVGSEKNPRTDNPVWAQRDSYPASGGRPTSLWLPGEIVLDTYELTAPSDAPPGEYRLIVGIYDASTGKRLTVNRAGSPSSENSLTLARFSLGR